MKVAAFISVGDSKRDNVRWPIGPYILKERFELTFNTYLA